MAGAVNLFGDAGRHSSWISWSDVEAADPDALLVFPCGFSLTRIRHEAEALRDDPGFRELRDLPPEAIERVDILPEEVALPEAMRRYLAAFGPASVTDVASFLGMSVGPVKAVLARLDLRRFRAEDGTELLDVEGGPLPDPERPTPVRFLPTWDAMLLVHARRTQVLPEAYRPLVFHTKMPPSYPTFLVDGQVAGTWKHEDGEVRLSPFGDLRPDDRTALEEEAHRLAAFHA